MSDVTMVTMPDEPEYADVNETEISSCWNDCKGEDASAVYDKDRQKTDIQDLNDKSGKTTAPPENNEIKPEDAGALKLKYMGEEIEVTRDEAIALAQKGKDYDHIRTERDELKKAYAKLKQISGQLHEESDSPMGKSVEQDTPAAMPAQKDTVSRLSLREKPAESKRPAAAAPATEGKPGGEEAAAAERARQAREFIAEYGSIDPKSIPTEVWEAAAKGKTLLSAYQGWENKQLKAQLEAERKQRENKSKSTGSRQTYGGQMDLMDEITKSWYEND